MERRPRRAKRALVKARCRASTALSRQGPFGLKIAALASRSETLRRRSSRYRLPRVFHWTQTTHRSRRLIQPSSEANSRHWLKPKRQDRRSSFGMRCGFYPDVRAIIACLRRNQSPRPARRCLRAVRSSMRTSAITRVDHSDGFLRLRTSASTEATFATSRTPTTVAARISMT